MLRAVLRDLASGPIAVQMRRFIVVGALTAGLQLALLWLFVDTAGLNYIVGATIAIEITIVCSYVLNNAWTFRASRNTGASEYLAGLLKTNLVRGTAIPIQLGVLAALVEWAGVMYLIANVAAILVSGLYRFVLDAHWTWG
ncbi:polysaccharide biosynthesis protein GtrA [Halorubrum ezzemoulense]|uniref:Polysaccharide biosynthesis protein GtrA n=1 Tax=Halorubrum ezzemoulense TaxID=337243 RepID=A0A256JFK0_HALEZ|nr:GtrA family protein [Halorubrum ezzemoulense]OYR67530.1 polysaccharide biosynthesis protein GtrA [Halorubrum ezzemoulense]